MRILYFLAHSGDIGGASNVLIKQASLMQKLSNEVLVIIQNDQLNKHSAIIDKVCEKYNLQTESFQFPIANCFEEIDILEVFEHYELIKDFVYDYSPDIIHSLQINPIAEFVSRELKIPHLMNVYPICKGMFNIKWLDIFPQYHSCDSIFYCKQWENGLDISSECIRVSYERPSIENEIKFRKAENEVISIGVFNHFKNQLEIIKFIEICRKKGISIHISFLGNTDSDYGQVCMEYVRKNDLQEYVDFVGVVVNVEKYLLQSDLLIHASQKESYPGVLVEAIVNRIPVLVNPVGGIPELFVDNINAFYINGSSAEEIYNSFETFLLYKNSGSLKDIIDNAYKTYLKNHTNEQVGNRLKEYYDHILDNFSKSERVKSLLINNVDIIFRNFISNINLDCVSEFTKSKLWYLYHLSEKFKCCSEKKVLVWGAGKLGAVALEWVDILKLEMFGFIDSNKSGRYFNYPIYSKHDDAIKMADIILVAIGNYDACREIMDYLDELGRTRNIDYFLIQNNSCL